MGTFETIGSEAQFVLISQNPKSGAGNRAKLIGQLVEQLTRQQWQVEVHQDVDVVCRRAEELLKAGSLRTVVSAGGDGTVSLLANRLPPEVPFTVLPMGTANLLAKYLDAPSDPVKVAANIASGKTVRMDVGRANEKLFLVVASCGFDADVVNRLHAARTGHISYWSYAKPLLDSIFKYRYPSMNFTADGQRLDSAKFAFVLNVPRYAIGLRFVENADCRDGRLDLCSFKNGGFFRGLYYFFLVLLRLHGRSSATQFAQFEKLVIESASGEEQIPVELDGDPAGCLPLELTVVQERLRVIVSDAWLDEHDA